MGLMNSIMKMWFMLSHSDRYAAMVLLFLMLIGMVLEVLGVGLIIPLITVLLQDDLAAQYPIVKPVTDYLGNPSQDKLIVYSMLFLLGVYTIKNLFLAILVWKQKKFAYSVRVYLGHKLFTNYLNQPYTFHLQHNSAQLIRNISGEVNMLINAGLNSTLIIVTEGLVLLGVLSLLISVEPMGAILVITIIGSTGIVFHQLTKSKITRWGKERQYHDGMLIQSLQQGLGGVKDVKIVGCEENFINEYDLQNKNSARIAQWEQVLQTVPRLWVEFTAVLALVMLVLSMYYNSGDSSGDVNIIPTLGLFAAAAFRLLPSLSRIISALHGVRFGLPVIDALEKDLKLSSPVKISHSTNQTNNFHEKIELDHICFAYPSAHKKSLVDISITIKYNESVGFIGTSGAGKSTLVDIILGLLIPDSGKVIVDKKNIGDNIRVWQNQIGYVPQSVYLTDNTLKQNVAFGVEESKIDEDAVWKALKSAQLEEFVLSQPEKLEVIVGERGVKLSGGQRQRIGIARALYRNPEILVLDEATSSLDMETEKGIMETIDALHGNKTIIIIAHRLSTIQRCDRVYKIEEGKVIAGGDANTVLSDTIMESVND